MNTVRSSRTPVEDAGANAAAHATAGNLPAEVTSFVGREAQLTQLLEVRTTTRVLTLVGPGGVGKSRFAHRLGTALQQAFRDGVWLVDVASVVDPGGLAGAVADALGVRAKEAQSWRRTLAIALRGRQLLLILDNCERQIVACAELAAALLPACPDLEVLATSREPLGLEGEVVWRVPGLSLPALGTSELRRVWASEAVRLFVTRASAGLAGFTLTAARARAVVHICRRSDGLPLALELLAAHVPTVGLDVIAARLNARYALRLEGGRDLPPRQRTLRATLDWSYGLLTEPDRAMLRRLAVFAGGWTVDAAEAVCPDTTLPAASVVDLLDRLVNRSLVTVDHAAGLARYRLVDIVRRYALELLQSSGEKANVERRHAQYVLQLAAQVHPSRMDPAHAARLDQDQGNLRAALRWTRHNGDPDLGSRLAIAAYTFWYMRGRYAEGRAWLTRWLAVPASWLEPGLRASVGCLAGHLSLLTGDGRAALRLLEEALEAQHALGDQSGIALTMHLMSVVALWGGDLNRARALGDKGTAALDSAGGHADRIARIESALLTTTARTVLELGDERRAGMLATQAAALAQVRDDHFWLARALHVQALVAERAGQHLPALRLIERAVALQRVQRDNEGLVESVCALGHLELSRGRVREAMAAFTGALHLAEQTGERIGLVWALEGVAQGLVSTQPENATKLAAACETLRVALGYRAWPSQRRRNGALLAHARRELGDSTFRAARSVGQRWVQADAVRLVHELASEHWTAQDLTADSLTPREGEVAKLLVQGLSNKQIAAQLAVSVGTVRVHVDHILGKLGLHSRAQVAVWASIVLESQHATWAMVAEDLRSAD